MQRPSFQCNCAIPSAHWPHVKICLAHRVGGTNKNSSNGNGSGMSTHSLFRQQRRLDGVGRAANDIDDDAEVDVRHKTPVVLMFLMLTMELLSLT